MSDATTTSSLWLMWWTFGFSLLSSVDLGEEVPLGIIWLLKMITTRVSYLKNVCHRPIRLIQCCTQFRSLGVKVLCVFHLHDNIAFTFKWYANTWNKTFYSQRIWIGYNIELAELVYSYAWNRECLRLHWPQGQLLRSSSTSATIYRSLVSLGNNCIAFRKWNIIALRPNWKISWRGSKGKYVTKLVRGSTQWQHSCQTTRCVFVGNIQMNLLVNCAPNCGMN